MGYIVKKNAVLKDGDGRACGIISYESDGEYTSFFTPYDNAVAVLKDGFAVLENGRERNEKRISVGAREITAILLPSNGKLLFTGINTKIQSTEAKKFYEDFTKTTRDEAAGDSTYEYDDYAIAETDYYQTDGKNGQKINAQAIENAELQESRQRQKEEKRRTPHALQYGTDASLTEEQKLLQRRLSKLPRLYATAGISRLSAVLPYSRWVRYGEAMIGYIGRSFKAEYLCYAINASGVRPQGAFLYPASHFKEGEGYYVTFLKL